jgi:YD repeat-containing protein
MIKKFLFSIWVCVQIFSCLFAQSDEKIDLSDIEASKEHVLDQRQNYFLTSTDYRITPKVNPITGEYCEEEVDLVVAGSQPLSVRRFYNSSAPYDPRYATWRYNPECFFVANLEWDHQEIFASIGDEDGSVCSFKRSSHNYTTFDFEVPKSFLAFQANGQSHPLNTRIDYRRKGDPKDKHRYEYRGTITDGSGRVRTFASAMHRWTHYVHWREKKGNWLAGSERLWRILPNTWTPYHIPVIEEKLPNGNILCYTYAQWKKEKQNYPLPRLLSSITAYNADKTKILGSIQLRYPRIKNDEVAGIQITGSDGRTTRIQHAGKSPINLASFQNPGQPKTTYSYNNRSLNKISRPEGRLLTTKYNSDGKVSAQYAPVGPNGEMHPIGRYIYSSHMTQVIDAEDNRVDYHFDDHKRLTCIAYVHRQEHFERDPNTGNLTRRTISDASRNPFQVIEYKYDKNHNPIEEREGNEKEWRTIFRTFSEDGFNLKLTETDRKDKLIRYTYIPGTNLLSSEITYEGNTIRKRIFHTYDDCAICIQTITDDGSTNDPHNLRGVTCRKITKITPKYSTPCFGLPESIEEKTIDSTGKEILLHKIVYTYTPFGEILQEDHYDANGAYSYSLYNTYDEQERLISKTDPLGAKTTYTYDANHNITSIAGPRSDQYREIAYDQVNRPIRFANWQTDGTILITEKRYNKLGQVIEETDPCGQITRFEYNELGRVTSVHHPDGAIEKKEYDILGNIIKEIDPEGYETTKTYNPFGQPLSIHYPDGSEELFTYNTTGTVRTHTDKNGATTNYTYDIFDHPICKEIYSANGKLLKKVTSTWTTFQKLSETEDDLTTDYTYDFAGRKIAEKQAYRLTEYRYDPSGRLACTKAGDTCQITEYDLCGRPTQIRTEKDGLIQKQEEYAYDEAGNCTQTITSQGIKETIYNTDGKPLSSKDPLGHCYRRR